MRAIPPMLRKLLSRTAAEPVPDQKNTNLLALIYRQATDALFINARMKEILTQEYLKDPRCNIKNTAKDRSSAISNLNRGLSSPKLSVKNFTKWLRIIKPVLIVFTLTLTFKSGSKRVYTVTYDEDKLFSEFSNSEGSDNKNFLRMLWDMIVVDLNIDETEFKTHVANYLRNPVSGYDKKNSYNSEASNLNRGLKHPNMTIENFTKVIDVINPHMATLKMVLHRANKSHSEHKASIHGRDNLPSPYEVNDDG